MSSSGLPIPGGDVPITPLGLGISVAFDLASALVTHLKNAKLPQSLIDDAQKVVDAVLAHKDDTMTQSEWEALRGT